MTTSQRSTTLEEQCREFIIHLPPLEAMFDEFDIRRFTKALAQFVSRKMDEAQRVQATYITEQVDQAIIATKIECLEKVVEASTDTSEDSVADVEGCRQYYAKAIGIPEGDK